MSTRHLGFLLCKNCGTLCISSIKSAKTYQNRAKNVKITRRSTFFKVFRRYFYAFTLRYAGLSCLSIRVIYEQQGNTLAVEYWLNQFQDETERQDEAAAEPTVIKTLVEKMVINNVEKTVDIHFKCGVVIREVLN
ncbi:MAG: hypothetical protein E7630_02835 [Ruminococcaceae bacterium]|nr:hypothetical protein [Oscillospiraceae bacterium]